MTIIDLLNRYTAVDNTECTVEDQLLLTLAKYRHNQDFIMMGNSFGLSHVTISKVFRKITFQLCAIFKQIDFWGLSFTDSNSYRAIIDCTEIPIARSANPICHQQTFSSYKNRPTIKILVACNEKGGIIFVSDVYGGSISDREIVIKSNFIAKLNKGEFIMADRGFNISDLLKGNGVLFNIPPFLRGKSHFSEKEVMETRAVAK